jgi:hypothetical protein
MSLRAIAWQSRRRTSGHALATGLLMSLIFLMELMSSLRSVVHVAALLAMIWFNKNDTV